jgi:hypothetical protein
VSPNEALLREHAAPRHRVADEHMFAVDYGPPLPATMRLQLFTAPGTQPVMVATQTTGEGPSLTNEGETYLGAAWRRFSPDEPQPPLWVQRQIFDDEYRAPIHYVDLVTFEKADVTTHTVAGPDVGPIDDEVLARLVGGPVDRGRGAGYVPRPPEPEQVPRFRVLPTTHLPRPTTFRAPGCMPAAGPPRIRRTIRRLRPDHAARDCCWYHGGSWHTVTRTAVHFLTQARREGVPEDEIGHRVCELARLADLSDWELKALTGLVLDSIWLDFGGRRFGNGSHRSHAMLDQGVRQVLIEEYVDPPDRAAMEAALAAWLADLRIEARAPADE